MECVDEWRRTQALHESYRGVDMDENALAGMIDAEVGKATSNYEWNKKSKSKKPWERLK